MKIKWRLINYHVFFVSCGFLNRILFQGFCASLYPVRADICVPICPSMSRNVSGTHQFRHRHIPDHPFCTQTNLNTLKITQMKGNHTYHGRLYFIARQYFFCPFLSPLYQIVSGFNGCVVRSHHAEQLESIRGLNHQGSAITTLATLLEPKLNRKARKVTENHLIRVVLVDRSRAGILVLIY